MPAFQLTNGGGLIETFDLARRVTDDRLDEVLPGDVLCPICPIDLTKEELEVHNLFTDSSAMVWDKNKPPETWESGSYGKSSYHDFPELASGLVVKPETAFVRDGDTLQQMGERAGHINSGILRRENKERDEKAKRDALGIGGEGA